MRSRGGAAWRVCCARAAAGAQKTRALYSKEPNAGTDPAARSCFILRLCAIFMTESQNNLCIHPSNICISLQPLFAALLQSDVSASEAQLSASGAPVVERCSVEHCQTLGKSVSMIVAGLWQYYFIGCMQVDRRQCPLVVM